MTDKTNQEKLSVIVSHSQLDVNLCAVAYELLKTCEPSERSQAFAEFIKSIRHDESDETMKLPVVITEREAANLMIRYGSYVDQKLDQLLKENLDENDFYVNLTDFIYCDEMLQDSKAGTIAIFDCVIDKRLPYHKLDVSGAISMENEQYVEVMRSIGDELLEKIDSAMLYDFGQKTERAGVVLSLVESKDSREERVVLLSRAFNHYEKQFIRLQERESKMRLLRELMDENDDK